MPTPPLDRRTRIRRWAQDLVLLVKETTRKSFEDDVERMGAALAFYGVFSLAPVLAIAVSVAAMVYGTEIATGKVQEELSSFLGEAGAEVVGNAMIQAAQPGASAQATMMGAIVLLLGASGAFLELHRALNTVWDCAPPPETGWISFLRRRLLSFVMVLMLGVLIVVSTAVTTVIRALGSWAAGLGVPESEVGLHALSLATTMGTMAPVYLAIYKLLPDTRVSWRDAAAGAGVTTVLTAVGQFLIGIYLGNAPIISAYGAAGSIVAVLVWVYMSAQILLIGAEFAAAWGRMRTTSAVTDPG